MRAGILLVALVFSWAAPLRPQASTEAQLWLDVLPHIGLSDRLEYFGDMGVRLDFEDTRQNTILGRPSLRYALTEHWEVHGGVGFFYTFVDSAGDQFEMRPWQGVRLSWPRVWRLQFKNYLRIEERVIWNTDTWDSDFTLRLRLQIATAVPLNAAATTYIPVAFEGFGDISGDATVDAYRNKARFYVGLGQQIKDTWAMEAELILQRSRSTSQDDFNLDDVILRVRLIRVGIPWWGRVVPGVR